MPDNLVYGDGGAVSRPLVGSTADVPGLTTALAGKAPSVAWTLADTFRAPSRLDATNIRIVRGIDRVDGRLFVADTTSGFLRQSTDWGTTFSANKGFPPDVPAANFLAVLRFKAHLYAWCKDSVDGYYKVYRALPQAANIQFTWELVHTVTASGVTNFFTIFDADDTAVYLGEYGDPTGGPRLYRTTDGVTWETQGPFTTRHIHAISPDPYNPGHVYMTLGDHNTAALSWMRSTDYGATWQSLNIAGRQSVQLSHTAEYVFGAADANNGTVNVYRKRDGVFMWGSANNHAWMPYPGGTTANDRFAVNAYYGIVDPATGVYYFVADGTAGQRYGLFAVPYIGADAVFIGEPPATVNTGFAPMYIGGGWLWWGQYKHQLLTTTTV